MSYVPIVVPHTPAPPSPRTRELADALARTIVDFEEKHPTVSNAEVRQAVQLAVQATSRGSDVAKPMMAAVAGLAALGAGAFVFLSRTPGAGSPELPIPLAAVAALIAVVGVVAIVLRKEP